MFLFISTKSYNKYVLISPPLLYSEPARVTSGEHQRQQPDLQNGASVSDRLQTSVVSAMPGLPPVAQ